MPADKRTRRLNRRGFLKTAASGAAAMAVTTSGARAQSASEYAAVSKVAVARAPSASQLARDAGAVTSLPAPTPSVARAGSDLMVQTLKELGVEFIASNPGSSFEGLQESIVNYGDPPNVTPEFITVLHEETSVDMASGYARCEGKPMCAMLHGAIGLQHASLAIYQAYCAGAPMLLIAGRDDGFIQAHTADDMAAIVRSFTKWDAQPKSLPHCLEAIQEAYRQAITPPTGPVLLVIDIELQKEEAVNLAVPAYQPPIIQGIDRATAEEIVQRLLRATNPRINVGQLRTPAGVRHAVELAELVGASTGTRALDGPMSLPQRHPSCGPGTSTDYDFTLGLERGPADVALMRPGTASLTQTRDRFGIGFGGMRRNGPEGVSFAPPVGAIGRPISVDAEASLPELISAAKRLMTRAQRRAIAERTVAHAAANRAARVTEVQAAIERKRSGWNGSPISTARLYAELWPLIMNEDWCLASPSNFSGGHHRELWVHDRPYSYLGAYPAGGIGYGAGACAGAALAARGRGRFVVNIQTDGDLNYAPGVLWSTAHHKLPTLTIMHNNRAWHQELMFLQYMAGSRGRGTHRAHIGTTLRDPFIDYKKMAEAYGMAAEGPIEDPDLLQGALARGVAAVKRGEPYLIDVLTQPR